MHPAPSRLSAIAACLLVAVSYGGLAPYQDVRAHGAPGTPQASNTQQVHVSVLDSRGAPVQGLTAEDFVVREDGSAREVLAVRRAEEPVYVALLVDNSQAASDATLYLREGLTAFLERLRGHGQAALITFGERPTLVEGYTADMALLQKHVARLFPRPGSGAYLLDAIVDASRGLAKRQAERRAIVALTFEGIDFSNRQYQQVLEELQKSGATLHVLAVGTPSPSLSDEMRNRNIVIGEGTARTGGRRDQVLANSGIPDRLKLAADELVHQYVITYARPEKLVPPEKLSVTTTRPDLTVRAPSRPPSP